VPWARSTLTEITYYQEYREELISKALDRQPEQAVPDRFLIYAHYGWKLGAYEDTSADKMIKSAARRAGIPEEQVSNHVLRRSGARMYLDAGGAIEDISIMLGHADTKTTMLYLGVSMDRLHKLQEKRDDYLEMVRVRMRAAPLTDEPMQTALFSR
jgi:site-specific recombinase XerD